MINEDFEHESQKDLVYLWEEQMQMEQEFWAEVNRKPAKILIVNNLTKTPKENESTEVNILPF